MNFKRNTTLSIPRRRRGRLSSVRPSVAKKLEPRAIVDFGPVSATERRSCFLSVVYKLALIQGGRATTRHACRSRFAKRESRIIYFGSTLTTMEDLLSLAGDRSPVALSSLRALSPRWNTARYSVGRVYTTP